MPLATRSRTTQQPPRAPGPPRRFRAPSALLAAAAALAAGPGCRTLGEQSPLALWRMGHDSSLSKGPTDAEVGPDDRNFMARWFKPKAPPPGNFDADPLVLGSDGWKPMKAVPNPKADKEFSDAEALFQQGKFAEAEGAFGLLAKNRKGTPWGEKGQFYLAETRYQRGNLVGAEDAFETLVADYKGTEYRDKVARRQFAIAEKWLAQSDPKTPAAEKLAWNARFTGGEPWLDTHGYGLRALEHVRHNNPDGELADDAVIRIADEHMKSQDYETAALYYDQLITDHAKSPFLQKAQFAAIDARMKGYIGPEYDGEGLEKARKLAKQTMQTNPESTVGNDKLYHTLALISDQDAERTFVRADYYKRAGYPASAEFYYAKIPQVWPKSPWAAKAKIELASLAKVPRKIHNPSKIMTMPGSTDPILNGNGNATGGGGMGGMGGGMGGMGGGMGGMGMN